MALTPAQETILRNYVNADPALSQQPHNSDGAYAIAQALNQVAAPAWIVWKEAYTPQEKASAIDVGITQLDALTSSKRDSLLWWAERTHDARLTSTQAAMSDLCGSQNTLKNSLIDGAKRSATVLEKLLASGTGTTASPGITTFTGQISYPDVQVAMQWSN